MKTVIVLIGMAVVAAGGTGYYVLRAAQRPQTGFRTAKVERGDLLSSIGATGTVEPQEVVDVGAQVAGIIKNLGPDYRHQKRRAESKSNAEDQDQTQPVGNAESPAEGGGKNAPADIQYETIDYGSVVDAPEVKDGKIVKPGTLLARIDDSIYAAQVNQADAALDRANADLKQLEAKALQAEQDWNRVKKLNQLTFKGISDIAGGETIKGMSDSDLDLARVNLDVAKANVEVGKAVIEQNEAALELAKTNLKYTVICSPVKGVIIDRRVNVGQTVVASLNAPSLFLIAKDLSKMQVWASVNEADIGRIRSKPNMPVTFTVDAYPKDKFKGTVEQVRLNATMSQNVVTYTVVVTFDNSDLKLLPYMTANLQFEVEQRRNVLKVPNAALRWKPRLDQVSSDDRESVAELLSGKTGGKEKPPAATSAGDTAAGKTAKDRDDRGRVWVKEGNFVRHADVRIGVSDGTMTEISGSGVDEGSEVVLGDARPGSAADNGETNPFAPKLFRSNQQPKTKE